MTFRIVLHNTPTVWSPGCIIQGKVVLSSSQDEAVSSVSIRFSGKEKTTMRAGQNSKYYGEVRFFTYMQHLFRGNYTFSASKQLEWPFQFVFPDTSVNKQSDISKDKFFRGPNDHFLPPTFFYETPMFSSYPAECRVQYKLSAELQRPSSFSFRSGSLSSEIRLTFIPHRPEASPTVMFLCTPSTWTIYSKKILPEFENYEPTMKEKVATMFSSRSKLPSSAFKILTKLASKVILGQSIPILVSATHLPEQSTTKIVPKIRLRQLSVAIESITAFCASSSFGRTHDDEKSEKMTIVNRTDLDIPLEPQPCNMGELLNVTCVPSLAPSFVSDIIKRRYALHLKIVVECAGCTKTIRASRMAFEVLSWSYMQIPLGPPPPLPLEMEPAREKDGEQLPSYKP
ncbi:hypothetical protein AJ78_01374 [Emergomyces pasteurianus Ep9510]|uniref:Arrestin-like N-terminal domain-containing protein n=1 Tax=Emergomyces pasteurianus Ep9510 TaxID=1447872 RepID=A0A1J9QEI0_9EURO|nr:hypothetical protein AJ78_01374 [Emergomyces pasteurianus Ep9510]